MKVKITDFKIDKTKERGQTDRSITTTLSRKWWDTKHCHHLNRSA